MPNTTWNPADKTANCALSGGNLTATFTDWPSGVRGVLGKSSGKSYFEVRPTTWGTTNPAVVGVGQGGGSITSSTGKAHLAKDGSILVNGAGTGSSLGARSAGDIIGIAIDITAPLIWFRVAPAGNWNGSGTANPATGAGGISLSTIAGSALYPWSSAGWFNDVVVANFGDSAFSGAVPSGFTAGWGTIAPPLGGQTLITVNAA